MRRLISRKGKGERIESRIEHFISTMPEDSKVAQHVRNEKRWLGMEGANKGKFGLRTARAYLGKYKKAIAAQLPHNSSLEAAIKRLDKKHKGQVSKLVDMSKPPADNIEAVLRFASELENKNCDLYDDLRTLKIAHKSYYMLKMKPSHITTMAEADKKAVVSNKRKKFTISKDAVKQAVKTGLEKDKNGVFKSNAKAVAALMLCSGRRPVELCITAEFDVKNKGVCIFEGQAKKKLGKTAEAYEIPILHISAKDFAKYAKELKAKINPNGKLTPEKLNGKLSSDATTATQKLLLNHDVSMYSCRAIYATQAAEIYCVDGDKDLYMAEILGHDKDDVNTVNSYQKIRLVDESISDAEKRFKTEHKRRDRVNALGRKDKEKSTSNAQKHAQEVLVRRLEKLQSVADEAGRAVSRINQWAIEQAQQDPAIEFTQTMITRHGGFSRPAIKKWLEIANV